MCLWAEVEELVQLSSELEIKLRKIILLMRMNSPKSVRAPLEKICEPSFTRVTLFSRNFDIFGIVIERRMKAHQNLQIFPF